MPSNAVRSVDSAWGGSRTSPSSCDPPDRFTHPICSALWAATLPACGRVSCGAEREGGLIDLDQVLKQAAIRIDHPQLPSPSWAWSCRAEIPVYAVAGAERPNTGRTLLNMLRLRQPRLGWTMTNSCLCRNFLRFCGTNVTKCDRRPVHNSTDGRTRQLRLQALGPGARRHRRMASMPPWPKRLRLLHFARHLRLDAQI